MTKIQNLTDKNGQKIFPVTHERAVICSGNKSLDTVLDEKQDNLVSGENIKTINGQAVLGEGNIDIIVKTDDKLKETEYPEYYLTDEEKENLKYCPDYYNWNLVWYKEEAAIASAENSTTVEVVYPTEFVNTGLSWVVENMIGTNQAFSEDVYYSTTLKQFVLKVGNTYYKSWKNSYLWNKGSSPREDTIYCRIKNGERVGAYVGSSVVDSTKTTDETNKIKYYIQYYYPIWNNIVYVYKDGAFVDIFTTFTDFKFAIQKCKDANNGSVRFHNNRVYGLIPGSTAYGWSQTSSGSSVSYSNYTIDGQGATICALNNKRITPDMAGTSVIDTANADAGDPPTKANGSSNGYTLVYTSKWSSEGYENDMGNVFDLRGLKSNPSKNVNIKNLIIYGIRCGIRNTASNHVFTFGRCSAYGIMIYNVESITLENVTFYGLSHDFRNGSDTGVFNKSIIFKGWKSSDSGSCYCGMVYSLTIEDSDVATGYYEARHLLYFGNNVRNFTARNSIFRQGSIHNTNIGEMKQGSYSSVFETSCHLYEGCTFVYGRGLMYSNSFTPHDVTFRNCTMIQTSSRFNDKLVFWGSDMLNRIGMTDDASFFKANTPTTLTMENCTFNTYGKIVYYGSISSTGDSSKYLLKRLPKRTQFVFKNNNVRILDTDRYYINENEYDTDAEKEANAYNKRYSYTRGLISLNFNDLNVFIDNNTINIPYSDIGQSKFYDKAYLTDSALRIPTVSEWSDLISNCTWTEATVSGVSGFTVAGKANTSYAGRSIFLPFTENDSYAYYWSANNMRDPDYGMKNNGKRDKAQALYICSGKTPSIVNIDRCMGCAIRPFKVSGSSAPASPVSIVTLYSEGTWADMNLGASAASGIGDKYAWGEIVTKSEYTWANYAHCSGTPDTCNVLKTILVCNLPSTDGFIYELSNMGNLGKVVDTVATVNEQINGSDSDLSGMLDSIPKSADVGTTYYATDTGKYYRCVSEGGPSMIRFKVQTTNAAVKGRLHVYAGMSNDAYNAATDEVKSKYRVLDVTLDSGSSTFSTNQLLRNWVVNQINLQYTATTYGYSKTTTKAATRGSDNNGYFSIYTNGGYDCRANVLNAVTTAYGNVIVKFENNGSDGTGMTITTNYTATSLNAVVNSYNTAAASIREIIAPGITDSDLRFTNHTLSDAERESLNGTSGAIRKTLHADYSGYYIFGFDAIWEEMDNGLVSKINQMQKNHSLVTGIKLWGESSSSYQGWQDGDYWYDTSSGVLKMYALNTITNTGSFVSVTSPTLLCRMVNSTIAMYLWDGSHMYPVTLGNQI